MANRFTADYSSSTASTPIVPSKTRKYGRNDTPELASTTPLVPPPSRVFGSSQFGSGVSKLRFSQNARDLPSQSRPNTFNLSTISRDSYDDDDQQDYTQDMEEDGFDDQDYTQYTQNKSLGYDAQRLPPMESLMKFSTNEPAQALKRSSRRSSSRLQVQSLLPRKGQVSFVPGLTTDLRKRLSPAELSNDPDAIIVQTEQILRSIQEEVQNADEEILDMIVVDSAKELERIWEGSATNRRRRKDEDLSIGPGPGATPFENARFVAVLMLRIYNSSKVAQDDEGVMTVPQILLDWLNEYHMTVENIYNQVVSAEPNVTADEFFWDVVESLTARGKLEEAMRLLQDADFSYAKIDNGAGPIDANYTGPELQAIQTAIFRLRQMLNASPSVQTGDWRIDGPDWIAYRRDVDSALEELRDSAETHDDSELLEAEAEDHLVRPGKGLPYDVFQRLQTVYNIMLGSSADLISISQDWLEASIMLTVWWSGSPVDKVQEWSFDVSRAHATPQESDFGVHFYFNRLRDSFLSVTDPSSKETWQLNHQSPLDLAIGLTLQGDVQNALALVQTYSLCVSSALAEMGSWSGWLGSSSVPAGLDKEDLMVLTNGAINALITKDEILELYSHELFDRQELEASQSTIVDGWEIAISVISRCDNRSLVSSTVQQYIDDLSVTTADRAQRLVTLCGELGMPDESRRVSEQYGDHLVNTSTEYGTALLCYARSQAEGKVRQLVDLLNSYCLVQSKAYPSDTDIDNVLSRLVSNPKQALAGIAETDPKAVEVLQFYLVGYACLRRFYTTRDNSSAQSTSGQKRTAAKALVAAINSAADSIYGGLYDPARQSAIQVDGLLPLLGEATALLAAHNDDHRIFGSDQLYAILAAIEDLQTVSDRVYAATEECLGAALRQSHGSLPPSPHAMLKKSISSGTNSNFSFSMMGSEMLAQSSESLGGRSMGSAVFIDDQQDKLTDKDDVARGWDWRSQFKARDTTGAEILQYLRSNIAVELSMANLEEGFH